MWIPRKLKVKKYDPKKNAIGVSIKEFKRGGGILPDGADEFLSQFKLNPEFGNFMDYYQKGRLPDCRRLLKEAQGKLRAMIGVVKVYEWPTGEIVCDGNAVTINTYATPEEKLVVKKAKLRSLMSSGIRRNLKKKRSGGHWEKLVDYTIEDLIKHLESKFAVGMHWGNMGLWHIDHIIPVVAFSFSCLEDDEFKRCWALGNLQPLWAEVNLSKGAKIGKGVSNGKQ